MGQKNFKALWLIVGTIFILVALFYTAQNLRDVERIIRNAGVAGPLVAVILYCIFALTPIPAEPLTLFCILFFGPIPGSFVTWIGGISAALVEYNFGLHMRRVANLKEAIKKMPFGLSKMPVDSPIFLIFGRLIPGFGGKVISLVAGVNHVPLRRYLWTTAVTTFIGSLILAFGGYHLLRFLKH